jgi:hypothetical protein
MLFLCRTQAVRRFSGHYPSSFIKCGNRAVTRDHLETSYFTQVNVEVHTRNCPRVITATFHRSVQKWQRRNATQVIEIVSRLQVCRWQNDRCAKEQNDVLRTVRHGMPIPAERVTRPIR